MLVIGVAFGAVLGAINGALVAVAKVPALVVTLGTLYIFRGIDFAWAQGSDDQRRRPARQTSWPSAPAPCWDSRYLTLIALAVVMAFGLYLNNLRAGREFYAIGSDVQAARLYGHPGRAAGLLRLRRSPAPSPDSAG